MTKKLKNQGPFWLRPFITLGILLATQTGYSQKADIDEGWTLLSRYLYREAAVIFEQAGEANLRQRDLGLAASLLNEPPVTSRKIDQAEKLLAGVIRAGLEDMTSVYALYLKARILHMHREVGVADIESAYRIVMEKDPQGGVAQLAASHLALLLLYQRPDLDISQRLAAAEKLETVAVADTLPEVALGYYRTLADASLFYEKVTPEALGWLRKAHAIESSDQLNQIGLSLQIAEVARALDKREIAVRYYSEFLATAVPTDQRYQTAEMRMQELEEMK